MKDGYLNDRFFSRLETLALNVRRDLRGYYGGKHQVRTYGQTVEFADYREYTLGDDIRRIDWNLYSRFEKYYLKLFTDERQMHVQIYIDCSGSMGKISREKGEYAIATAAALGFLAVHNTDKVSYGLIRNGTSVNPFGTIVGKTSFYRAIGELSQTEFGEDSHISRAITGDGTVGGNDGITIIISDFLTENDWKKAIDYLNYKKRQVLLIQILSPEEIDPVYTGRVNLIDSESMDINDGRNIKLRITRGMQEAYAEALRDIIGELKSYSASRGAGFISLRTDEPVEKALFRELFKTEIIS